MRLGLLLVAYLMFNNKTQHCRNLHVDNKFMWAARRLMVRPNCYHFQKVNNEDTEVRLLASKRHATCAQVAKLEDISNLKGNHFDTMEQDLHTLPSQHIMDCSVKCQPTFPNCLQTG
ncbi:hypothetical protein BJ742DRAFT_805288 [Cladochytrium replicatum]|nr:hypothetical protein BJ742DRAFT_805288 [Cladochytrium replicatum]